MEKIELESKSLEVAITNNVQEKEYMIIHFLDLLKQTPYSQNKKIVDNLMFFMNLTREVIAPLEYLYPLFPYLDDKYAIQLLHQKTKEENLHKQLVMSREIKYCDYIKEFPSIKENLGFNAIYLTGNYNDIINGLDGLENNQYLKFYYTQIPYKLDNEFVKKYDYIRKNFDFTTRALSKPTYNFLGFSIRNYNQEILEYLNIFGELVVNINYNTNRDMDVIIDNEDYKKYLIRSVYPFSENIDNYNKQKYNTTRQNISKLFNLNFSQDRDKIDAIFNAITFNALQSKTKNKYYFEGDYSYSELSNLINKDRYCMYVIRLRDIIDNDEIMKDLDFLKRLKPHITLKSSLINNKYQYNKYLNLSKEQRDILGFN